MTDNVPLHEAHAHSMRCYWDLNVCRWVCQQSVGDGNRSINPEDGRRADSAASPERVQPRT
jgi:hypothetical protein